jgi:hypothetical protein
MTRPVESVVEMPEVRDSVEPLRAWHRECAEAIAREGDAVGGVLYCDLTAYPFHRYPKFVPYALFPDALFAVVLIDTLGGVKVSVGSNPWKPAARAPNLAALCERHGGGGHRFVAAVTLPPGQTDRARAIAWEFVSELKDVSDDSGVS